MNHRIEKIWTMAKLIKSVRSRTTGDGEGKTPCAEFHITVYEEGNYDRVIVQVESSDAIMVDGISACAYFMALMADRAGIGFEEGLAMLCDEAKEYETKVLSMPRRRE